MSTVTVETLCAFVYNEARLLDECRYDEWLALFAEDAYYWMPLEPGQTDARLVTSLMHEDLFMLTLRVRRLSGQRTYSQQPQSRCHHLLQRPAVDRLDESAGEYETRTAFHYVETRVDEQTLYAAWATHGLVMVDGALRIRTKRVDLVNCDAAFGNIQLIM